MVSSQPFAFARKRAAATLRRAGVAGFVAFVGMLVPVQLDAAVDGSEAAHGSSGRSLKSQSPALGSFLPETVPGAGAAMVSFALARAETIAQAPGSDTAGGRTGMGDLARPRPPDPAPSHLGFVDRMWDWLARSNREFQTTVVPRLSIPSAGGYSPDDAIARKIERLKGRDGDVAASIRRADDALKSVEAKREQEAQQRALEASRAEEEKALALAEAKRAEIARREEGAKAEQQRRALLAKSEADALAREAKDREAGASTSVVAASPTPEDTARLAEELRKERERIEAEAARIEKQRIAAEAQRKADEARAREVQRVRAAAELADEQARLAKLKSEKDTQRTVELTTEPIPQAELRPAREDAAPVRKTRVASRTARAPTVKRWIWRSSRHGSCRLAGRRITPPGRYVVRRGDTLWGISRRHYRAGRHYMRIYRANRGILRSPHRIYPCQRLVLPRRL